jgi:hypothetical protein
MNLVERAKNIIINPKEEWGKVAEEEATMASVIISYVIPLALIPTVAAFIGYGFIGYNVPFFGKVTGISWGIQHAVTAFAGSLLGVTITAFVVDLLAPSFGSEKNIARSTQLVAYAFTPGFVGGILNVLPSLAMLGVLVGLYGIYLLYLGIPVLKKTPEDKTVVYLIVSILALIVAYAIIGVIVSSIMVAAFGLGTLGV